MKSPLEKGPEEGQLETQRGQLLIEPHCFTPPSKTGLPAAERAPQGFAPLAIGLGLTLIHLISIPVTNTSVNPARSTGPAVIVGGWALEQLWLFWIAPLIGAAPAGLCCRGLPVQITELTSARLQSFCQT